MNSNGWRWEPRAVAGVLAGLLVSGCAGSARPGSGPADWQVWRAKRHESIAGTNGWITLVGRHWLREGANRAGTAVTDDVVLPAGRVPAWVGTFHRSGKAVRFEAAPGVEARIDGQSVRAAVLSADVPGPATRLAVGAVVMNVIERGEQGEKIGIRVRDSETPARAAFPGLACFPYDPAWRLEGRFEAYAESREMRVSDVTGGFQSLRSPGELVFRVGGAERRLQVVEEPGDDRLFVIFRDRTAGRSTYAAGRFLYVDRPAAGGEGRVVIDFNRAYTPPCGFTAYATCPLPPPGNRLPLEIRAGERAPAGHP